MVTFLAWAFFVYIVVGIIFFIISLGGSSGKR